MQIYETQGRCRKWDSQWGQRSAAPFGHCGALKCVGGCRTLTFQHFKLQKVHTICQLVKQKNKQMQAAQFEYVLLTTQGRSYALDGSSLWEFKHSFEMIYNSLSSTKTLLLSRSSRIINSPAQAALIVALITPVQLTSCLPLLVFDYDTKVYFAQTSSNV